MDGKTGERLLAYRKAHGLTQEQLAEKVFVTRQAVSKWERGESLPDLEVLVALAEIYGVTLDEIVRGESGAQRREVGTADIEADTADLKKRRRKKLLFRMIAVFVLTAAVWSLLCGIVQSSCVDVEPYIWLIWFTLPVVAPLAVLAAFFHYIPAEWRAYFFLVPFVSGLLYLVLQLVVQSVGAWLVFLLIPVYYIPAVLYTVITVRSRRKGATDGAPTSRCDADGEEKGASDE